MEAGAIPETGIMTMKSMTLKSLKEQVISILTDPVINNPESEEDPAELIYKLAKTARWDEFLAICEEILLNDDNPSFWTQIALVLFRATGDRKDFSSLGIDRVIALLYYRHMDEHGIEDGNLIWSITLVLKNENYDSDYEPFKDEGVWSELQELTNERSGAPPKRIPRKQ
jgi:hypothetical protein